MTEFKISASGKYATQTNVVKRKEVHFAQQGAKFFNVCAYH